MSYSLSEQPYFGDGFRSKYFSISIFFPGPAFSLREISSPLQAAVAHVNGADPKLYFLRDRNLWLVDDWASRFGAAPRFLTCHPCAGAESYWCVTEMRMFYLAKRSHA